MNAPGTRFGLAESAASLRQQRIEGEAFAARWRDEQPHKAMLDTLYPPFPVSAEAVFPYPDHLFCDEWTR